MHKLLVLMLTILALTGCGRKPVPQAPLNDEPKQTPRAEFKVGGEQHESRHLAFKITAVHEKQKLSPHAPFNVEGGEWTFFDCQASSDPNVAFTVGVLTKSSTGNVPVVWGKAVLIVKDREMGARFVELFSKAFGGKLPKPLKQVRTDNASFSLERHSADTASLR
jgi:predicted small lipoprotein YifL